jgi:peptide deformylase
MILPILKHPHTALDTVCTEWNFVAPVDVVTVLETNMIETMLAANGIGLAANQVGILERFMAMKLLTNNQCLVMYNPRLLSVSDETETVAEGCLSFPEISYSVNRNISIEIEYQDRYKNYHNKTLTGWDARCFQHELDHLNGITFDERATDVYHTN